MSYSKIFGEDDEAGDSEELDAARANGENGELDRLGKAWNSS
jgi:hypothetical protein